MRVPKKRIFDFKKIFYRFLYYSFLLGPILFIIVQDHSKKYKLNTKYIRMYKFFSSFIRSKKYKSCSTGAFIILYLYLTQNDKYVCPCYLSWTVYLHRPLVSGSDYAFTNVWDVLYIYISRYYLGQTVYWHVPLPLVSGLDCK